MIFTEFRTISVQRLALVVGAVSLAPWMLNVLGVDFGTPRYSVDFQELAESSPETQLEAAHHLLAGSFTHTILEWSAFATAVFTVILSLVVYAIRRDFTIVVISTALFWAGCMDAFHTLAADRLIHATTGNKDLIPFTWAICRAFNALIIMVGAGIVLVWLKHGKRDGGNIAIVGGISLCFGIVAYAIISFCAGSDRLPQTTFPDATITRPWDVVALMIYLAGGIVLFRLFREVPGAFSAALLVATIPNVMTQAHMAFGSVALFDNHFNIGHFLKIIAYLVPFGGLTADYIATGRKEILLTRSLMDEVSERRQVEQRLSLATRSASIGIWDLDLVGRNSWFNETFVEMFGRPSSTAEAVSWWRNRIHESDRDRVVNSFHDALASSATSWTERYQLQLTAGPFADVIDRAHIHRDPTGKATAVLGAVTDVTEQRRSERIIRASLEEKETLLKEIHHRVKNNLQVIVSLLRLQRDTISNEEFRTLFDECVGRVRSMAMVHERLYQSNNLSSIQLDEHLRMLTTEQVKHSRKPGQNIELNLDLEPMEVNLDAAIPLGLLANELLSNAFKHGFNGRSTGHLTITLTRGAGSSFDLVIADDGPGWDGAVNPAKKGTLGMLIIKGLLRQLRGELTIRNGNGTAFQMEFPDRDDDKKR